jgi:hypothetical protein
MNERPADDLFWSSDAVAAVAKVAPPRDGLQLLAPAQVEVEVRQNLPAVLRRKTSLRDDMLAPLPRFATIVALDLVSDEAFAGPAQATRDGEPSFREPDAKTLARVMPAKTTQALLVDLRTTLALPWRAGELLVFGAARDLRSEPVHVVLHGAASGEPRPAREREVEVHSREKTDGSPEFPRSVGISMSVDARHRMLHGAWHLNGANFIHLVFCGRTYPQPIVVRLRAHNPQGYFNLELPAVGLGSPQAYTVWAVTRDAIGGPVEVPAAPTAP